MNHKSNEVKLNKPPVGLKPRQLHDDMRLKEILAAMSRYALGGKKIPKEWVDEFNDLTGY